ncbi:hypothetical protein QG37_08167 [Candidozyma auris]|nr:hypothetical protein QG37_08167 [[Candida] auris]
MTNATKRIGERVLIARQFAQRVAPRYKETLMNKGEPGSGSGQLSMTWNDSKFAISI